MARILLEVSVNTGRPHPRLPFESCDRAVASPDEYGSGTHRASDYGDLIKGSLECQPIPFRAARSSGCWRAAESSFAGHNLPRPYAAFASQTHTSMVAGPAHTAGAALRLGVPSLRRDQVELLLCLVEAETDTLLIEQPEIAADGCVDQP